MESINVEMTDGELNKNIIEERDAAEEDGKRQRAALLETLRTGWLGEQLSKGSMYEALHGRATEEVAMFIEDSDYNLTETTE